MPSLWGVCHHALPFSSVIFRRGLEGSSLGAVGCLDAGGASGGRRLGAVGVGALGAGLIPLAALADTK